MLSPSERSLRARLAAHSLHAQQDSRKLTANARSAFLQRFIDEVDPERVLSEPERLRRAGHARSAYFAQLAFASSKARRKRRSRPEKELTNHLLLFPEEAVR